MNKEKKPGAPTVLVMDETDDTALCLRFTGLIRADDHRRNLWDNLKERCRRHGWYNMLILYDEEYRGWEEDAADSSLQSILDVGKYARRLAYVNPPEKKILQSKLSGPLLGGEIRHYNAADLPAALDWVKGRES